LFAAKYLASQGVHAVLLNRDIKPGGLAEYGIYPDKHRMKEGLRQQFRQILDMPNVEYFGNLTIGQAGDVSLDDLRRLGFQALLITVGAQGTKWLGLPGEDLEGVYHAKDIVYHYNKLPPFSERQFHIGRKVAVIGVGNVMLDIAHWLIRDRQVDEVIALARRGPAEVKFTRTELEYVVANLDRPAFEAELARITPKMRLLGQDPNEARQLVEAASKRAVPITSNTVFCLQFLVSPSRILGHSLGDSLGYSPGDFEGNGRGDSRRDGGGDGGSDGRGRVVGLEVENNRLSMLDGEVKARGLGTYRTLEVDTVIFAIGDRVDKTFGLPVLGNEFVKNPTPRFPVEGVSFEAYDPEYKQPLEGTFVAGWSRQASTGLVGVARKDGTLGARAVIEYLHTLAPLDPLPMKAVRKHLAASCKSLITRAELLRLEAIEQQQAQQLGLEEFKFASNQEMLEAILGKAEIRE
jgi:ferredoxin--NADP+ reductase